MAQAAEQSRLERMIARLATQRAVLDAFLGEMKGRGVIWSLHRPGFARNFDHIVVLKGGRAVEQGSFAELDKEGSVLRELLESE